MIPSTETIELLNEEIEEVSYPSRTYNIVHTSNDTPLSSKISGYVDDIESIEQAIYLILSTERYAYLIYSWDYGVELADLIGQPMSYVMSELPRRIEEALTMDDRIEGVIDFEFIQNGKKLHTKFTVVTTAGEIESELEVDI